MRKAKWYLLLLLCLTAVLPSLTWAQNHHLIDSLTRKSRTSTGIDLYHTLNALGFEYRHAEPDSTIAICRRAFELGKKLQLKRDLSRPLSFIGLAYANEGKFQESFEYHLRAIDVATEQQDSAQIGHAYNNLSRMYFDQGDFQRSYETVLRARDIFLAIHDDSGLAYVYRSISHVHQSQAEIARAIETAQMALALRRKGHDQRTIISSLVELGSIYQSNHQLREAKKYFLEADSLAAHLDDPVTEAEINLGLAELHILEGKDDYAMATVKEALRHISSATNIKLYCRARMVQALALKHQKKFKLALTPLMEVLETGENSGSVSMQRDACHELSQIHLALGNVDIARAYESQFRILEQQSHNNRLSQEIERLQFQLALEKKEKENERLLMEQSQNEAKLSLQRTENSVLIISILGLTMLLVIIWLESRRRRVINKNLLAQNETILQHENIIARHNKELSEQNRHLEELNNDKTMLMNIVAHDLKSPFDRIVGLMGLLQATPGLTAQQEEFVRLAKNVSISSVGLITDILDVSAMSDANRLPVFRMTDCRLLVVEKIRSFQPLAHAKQIQFNHQEEGESVFQTDADYVSRIIDNLISNAIKFSPAGSTISVVLRVSASQLVLSIKDQGPGFSDDDKKQLYGRFKKLSARPTKGESSNGLGLAIVKTLVERLHGTIELDSAVDQGSTFTVILPSAKD
ncbi:MAG: tetratricopeptide repeat protein [Cyclobacteriaceae bacterium]|nr:tetratricopeptide repeat protein [Cyclobacteriaceae bacterium]